MYPKIAFLNGHYRNSNGTIYGYAKDGKIYLTDRGLNPNTPIHEYTHLWVKAVRNNNAELYDNLRNLFSRESLPDMWDELDNDPQYRDLSDEAKLSEIIARFSSKRGAERMEQEAQKRIDEAKQQGKRAIADAVSLRERMRNLLRRFWNWVGEHLFHIKHFGSREETADRVLYDLLNGTDLGQSHTEQDNQAEFSTSPMPKRVEGEMVHEWAKRIAEWKRQQVDEQQVAEYAKLLDQNGSKKSQLFAQIVDKFTPIDNFQQWVQAQGGVYDEDTMDMHADISLALGRIETFSRRYKNDYMQRIADSITSIVKDADIADPLLALGLKWQNFDNKKMNGKPLTVREIMGVYAQAKDTWEAEQQGLSDRGAQGFVKNLGASHTNINARIDQLRRELRNLTQPAARAKRETEIVDLQDQLIYTGRASDTMLEHRTRDERLQHQVVVLRDGQQYIIELQDERLANAVNNIKNKQKLSIVNRNNQIILLSLHPKSKPLYSK